MTYLRDSGNLRCISSSIQNGNKISSTIFWLLQFFDFFEGREQFLKWFSKWSFFALKFQWVTTWIRGQAIDLPCLEAFFAFLCCVLCFCVFFIHDFSYIIHQNPVSEGFFDFLFKFSHLSPLAWKNKKAKISGTQCHIFVRTSGIFFLQSMKKPFWSVEWGHCVRVWVQNVWRPSAWRVSPVLQARWYFDCECSRCADPADDMLTAIKCSTRGCPEPLVSAGEGLSPE